MFKNRFTVYYSDPAHENGRPKENAFADPRCLVFIRYSEKPKRKPPTRFIAISPYAMPVFGAFAIAELDFRDDSSHGIVRCGCFFPGWGPAEDVARAKSPFSGMGRRPAPIGMKGRTSLRMFHLVRTMGPFCPHHGVSFLAILNPPRRFVGCALYDTMLKGRIVPTLRDRS